MDEEMYTIQEVADMMKVSGRTVRNWIDRDGLPAFPIGKRGYRIAKSDLLAFINARKLHHPKSSKLDTPS